MSVFDRKPGNKPLPPKDSATGNLFEEKKEDVVVANPVPDSITEKATGHINPTTNDEAIEAEVSELPDDPSIQELELAAGVDNSPLIPIDAQYGLGMDDDGETADIGLFAEQSYLAYAMSVVLSRALPWVDGQKPVQRRILYAMNKMGLHPGVKYTKSARVVGEVLGKYHPHGDSSAYDASTRIAQPFTLRYPLIDGQGNYGSRDGDNAAAMRYTEMRLAPISELLLSEIDLGTVDFVPNYDGAYEEPSLMPARLPILLMNGVSGIAVGMRTYIPPHNIREVTEAAILAVKELSVDPERINDTRTDTMFNNMMEIIQGPDFPEGAQIISDRNEILAAYKVGRGSIRMRCRWSVEQLARGQYRIAITEIPYEVKTTGVMASIDEIANPKIKKNKKALDQEQINNRAILMSLVDTVRNESGKFVRIVIEPKTSKVDPNDIMNFLMVHTDLECACSLNMTMIGLDGKPRQKGIVEVLREWAQFRFTTVTRRTQFVLNKTLARIHILEGRMIAFLHIDAVIKVIRESDEPKEGLINQFKLSEIQAEDILEIRLRQLARLEGIRIENEINELRPKADALQELLDNDGSMRNLIVKEMRDDLKKYGDDRRTLMEPVERVKLTTTIMATDDPVTIIVSRQGWIRARQGHDVDVNLLTWKPGDSLLSLIKTRTVNQLIFLDHKGRSYSVLASNVPGGKGDGVPVSTLVELQDQGRIAHVFSGKPTDRFLFAGDKGYGFIAALSGMVARSKAGKAFMTIDDKDKELVLPPLPVSENFESGSQYLASLSSQGRMLVFNLNEMKVLNSGGKGVMIMDIPDEARISQLSLHEYPLEVIVEGKRGKPMVLAGDSLQKHILKRARKGAMIG